ncbi:hypothetical protein DID88_007275 [Monilinia fructigena]|uniref:Uncharacterized protein n=1 Tax=Monilinia fructigena TaxID=38457 RepID=A0A395JCS4_9HELO|nr:hypothetical protein DID88_007275 [Monilinia fructigena]
MMRVVLQSSAPSCRGKLDMAKLIDYRTFKKAHMPPSELEEEKEVVDSSDDSTDSDSENDSDSDSDDADENGNLDGFIIADNIEDDEAGQGDDENDGLDMEVLKSEFRSESKSKSRTKTKEKRKKGKGKQVEKHKQHSFDCHDEEGGFQIYCRS